MNQKHFDFLTPKWLLRAHVYTGSIGEFRYRFASDGKNKTVEASTYTHWCFEKANDVETRQFTWDDDGIARLREWLESEYERRIVNTQADA